MGLLVSESSVVVSIAVWGSLVYPQGLWTHTHTHTHRFKDNIVFMQACMNILYQMVSSLPTATMCHGPAAPPTAV